MRFRTLTPALLSAALFIMPAPARATPRTRTEPVVSALAASRAGLYKLTLSGTSGEQNVDLALEQAREGFSALLLTPAHETWLSNVKFDGRKLTGTALTSAGRGTLVLEMTDAGVHGTLTVAGSIIAIAGTRDR
jgi:hypothetical protein